MCHPPATVAKTPGLRDVSQTFDNLGSFITLIYRIYITQLIALTIAIYFTKIFFKGQHKNCYQNVVSVIGFQNNSGILILNMNLPFKWVKTGEAWSH